jgi:hypothetical protein
MNRSHGAHAVRPVVLAAAHVLSSHCTPTGARDRHCSQSGHLDVCCEQGCRQLRGRHKLTAKNHCCAEYASCLAAVYNEVLITSPGVSWGDIAGLESTKQVLQEAVVLPSIRPDIFTGLRSPSKGARLCFAIWGTSVLFVGSRP